MEKVQEKGRRWCYVTGGSGFVGYNLILELIETKEWNIICLYIKSDPLKQRLFDLKDNDSVKEFGIIIRCVEGDVLDRSSMRKCIPEEIDCVFHLAGCIAMDERKKKSQLLLNVGGTEIMCEVCLEKKVKRFVYTSSSSVYGNSDGEKSFNEEKKKTIMESSLNYGKSKYLAEKKVFKYVKKGLKAVVIQPNYILGENNIEGAGFSQLFIKLKNGKLSFLPNGGGSFDDVKEVAKVHIAAANKGKIGESYLLGGEFMYHRDLIRLISKKLKVQPPKYQLPHCLGYCLVRTLEGCSNCCGKKAKVTLQQFISTSRIVKSDSTKARKELGYKITPVSELVERQMKYMIENDLL